MSKFLTYSGSFPRDFPLRSPTPHLASRTATINAPQHLRIRRNLHFRTSPSTRRRKVTPLRRFPPYPSPVFSTRSTQNSRPAFPIASRPTAKICRIFLRHATPTTLCRPAYSERTTQIALFAQRRPACSDRPIPTGRKRNIRLTKSPLPAHGGVENFDTFSIFVLYGSQPDEQHEF